MTQIAIMLFLGVLSQPQGPTAEDLAKCADCHEDFDKDTLPGMHTVSGGCLSCHFPHEVKNGEIVPPTPPTVEKCLECHSDVAESTPHPMKAKLTPDQQKAIGGEKKSTDLGCMDCHKLHHAKSEMLLSMPLQGSQLCIACHSSFATVLGGVHDLRNSAPTEKNQGGKSANDAGPCSSCHMVHTFARPVVKDDIDTDGNCLTCHRDDGPASRHTGQPFVHPAAVSCSTCHDPHQAAAKSPSLLKVGEDSGATGVCLDCHTEMATVQKSLHSRDHIHKPGTETECGACHAIHGPTRDWTGGTWIAPSPKADALVETRACTGCHSAAGGQPEVYFRRHPALRLIDFQKAGDAGYMPLIDLSGKAGPEGVIGCITCHIAHGRLEEGGFKYPVLADGNVPLTRASRPMIRPFLTPNLCTACHGSDALQRFLYFHRRSKN